jgi:hypothetical protein
LPKKLQTQNLGREKLRKILLCKKAASKLFVKLPPIVQFINILQAAFFTISFFGKNHKNKMKVGKKLHKPLLFKKAALKMLVKLTLGSSTKTTYHPRSRRFSSECFPKYNGLSNLHSKAT